MRGGYVYGVLGRTEWLDGDVVHELRPGDGQGRTEAGDEDAKQLLRKNEEEEEEKHKKEGAERRGGGR